MTQDAHIIVKGFVQGVGYRSFVRKQALRNKVTGWVRNLPDGTVELLLQGEKKQITEILHACQQGSFLAEVTSIDTLWQKQEEKFSDFIIRHDS